MVGNVTQSFSSCLKGGETKHWHPYNKGYTWSVSQQMWMRIHKEHTLCCGMVSTYEQSTHKSCTCFINLRMGQPDNQFCIKRYILTPVLRSTWVQKFIGLQDLMSSGMRQRLLNLSTNPQLYIIILKWLWKSGFATMKVLAFAFTIWAFLV